MTKDWASSEALEERICELLSEGKSLREICRQEDMPSRRTVMRWIREDENFAAKCAHAREEQADWLNDDMADIEGRVLQGELDFQAARVVLSSKQWRAAKLAPKKYGERHQVEHSGSIGKPKPISNEEAMAEIAELSGALGLKYQLVEVVEEGGE